MAGRILKQPGLDTGTDVNVLGGDGVQSVTVHYGEETFSPVQYNSFRIGGHSLTLVPRPGESALECVRRGRAMLEALGDEEYAARFSKFKQRLATR